MSKPEELLTFGEHLDVLRGMLFRILGVVGALAIGVFCCKEFTFRLLLAPVDQRFILYRGIEAACAAVHFPFHFEPFHITLISTELSAQFMTHLSTSIYLALLLASPYIVLELFRFIAPALYAHERRLAFPVAAASYILFLLGVLMTYFILFPISLRFLGTYQVAESVESQITIASYTSSFLTLALLMSLVFQVPVLVYILSRMDVISSDLMRTYRRHAALIILVVAAIITPPDLFTLVLVALPLLGLYEVSIRLACGVEKRRIIQK